MFNVVELEWKGKNFSIPANRMMGAIASIEEFVTLNELYATSNNRQTVKLAQLSGAYAAVLNYAGAKVTQEEVYESIFSSGNAGAGIVSTALQTLILMMVPAPSVLPKETEKGKGNRQALLAAARLSKKHTKRL